MNRKRLLFGKKDSDLYNNVWGLFNTQAMTAKFLYNLGLQDLDEKFRFNKDVNMKNLFFIFLIKFRQWFIYGKVENTLYKMVFMIILPLLSTFI